MSRACGWSAPSLSYCAVTLIRLLHCESGQGCRATAGPAATANPRAQVQPAGAASRRQHLQSFMALWSPSRTAAWPPAPHPAGLRAAAPAAPPCSCSLRAWARGCTAWRCRSCPRCACGAVWGRSSGCGRRSWWWRTWGSTGGRRVYCAWVAEVAYRTCTPWQQVQAARSPAGLDGVA